MNYKLQRERGRQRGWAGGQNDIGVCVRHAKRGWHCHLLTHAPAPRGITGTIDFHLFLMSATDSLTDTSLFRKSASGGSGGRWPKDPHRCYRRLNHCPQLLSVSMKVQQNRLCLQLREYMSCDLTCHFGM